MTAAIVFDLDGTLVDSAPDIAAAVNRMLADQGQAPLDQATVTSFVGNGLPHLVKLVIDNVGLEMTAHAELVRSTLDHYNRSNSELTVVYPGMLNALEQLNAQGCPMGICTNKPEGAAHHVLEALGLARFFDVVIGGDSLKSRKPDPEMLHAAFDALPALPRIYVGDSEVDAQTAQRAGVRFLLYTEGYRKGPVETLPHFARYDDCAELPALVELALKNSGT